MNEELAVRQQDPVLLTQADCQRASASLPQTGFVRLPTVLKLYPVSRAKWWADWAEGKVPRGVLLSRRIRAWSVEEIRSFLESVRHAG
jgi:predicted DNA-binding transcriptional regulator AlpA